MELKELPLGVASFDIMIDDNYVYVDKTDLIAEIAKNSYPQIFARPRRFGKSTLVNTFHELFANGLERFKGLKIERDGLYTDTKTYRVLHLDFSTCSEDADLKGFLLQELTMQLTSNGIDFDDQVTDPRVLIRTVLYKEDHKSIVLLIDEYDSPLTVVLDNDAEFAKRLAIFRSFYANIKLVSSRFRFVFITGVSRYSNMSISGFNNLTDLSLNPRFGALLGYTQEELECYFGAHIEHAACVLNQVNNTEQYSYKSVLQLLKQHYNGYCFDEQASTLVYNPWSVLSFLQEPYRGFKNYWGITGFGLPTLLLKCFDQPFGNSFFYKRFLDLDQTVYVREETLLTNTVGQNISELSYIAVLYQSGYLTIKSVSDGGFTLGVPNLEVKTTYSTIILELLQRNMPITLTGEFSQQMQSALQLNKFEDVKSLLNECINSLNYDTVSKFNESSFRDLFSLVLFFVGAANIQTEVPNAVGRIDLKFNFGDTCFVCEFKVASNLSEVEAKLAEAERQMVSNKYARILGAKNVVPLAIVAVNQGRGSKDSGESGDSAVREIAVIKPVDISKP